MTVNKETENPKRTVSTPFCCPLMLTAGGMEPYAYYYNITKALGSRTRTPFHFHPEATTRRQWRATALSCS